MGYALCWAAVKGGTADAVQSVLGFRPTGRREQYGGTLSWSVVHDSEKGRYHIEVHGEVPLVFASVRIRLKAAQDAAGGDKSDADYIYDVPIELARALTGFRHDQDISGDEGDAFHVLERAKKTSRWKLF